MEQSMLRTNQRAAAGFGIILLALGIATKNYGVLAAGLMFFVLGLVRAQKAKST